jgi:hypothetical protein
MAGRDGARKHHDDVATTIEIYSRTGNTVGGGVRLLCAKQGTGRN